jgi:hypothetical protein
MRIMDANTLSAVARRSAESVSDFASVVRNLILDVRDSYRPEVHDMRGPGPKWRTGQHELSPVHVRPRDQDRSRRCDAVATSALRTRI